MNYIDLRGAALSRAIAEKIGNEVYSGPFKGMELNIPAHSDNFAPYLLGIYEHELHPVIEQIISKNYQTILNVGCSFGYYAVGLARALPNARVFAIDNDDNAIISCLDMAALNNVNNLMAGKSLELRNVDLIVMDCEGAEEEYLNGGFEKTDILVELHECIKPRIANKILERFTKSHTIELVYNKPSTFDLTKIFGDSVELEHFDNSIVTFEGRAGATPWAWMIAK